MFFGAGLYPSTEFFSMGVKTAGASTFSKEKSLPLPIGSMYGIFTHIWLIFLVKGGKYTTHGSYGLAVALCYTPEPNRLICQHSVLEFRIKHRYLGSPQWPFERH